MKHVGDITKLSGYTLPAVDCITGGSPCQDLSIAGQRKGLAGERSGLFMEQIRLIKELRDADRKRGRTGVFIRPRYMVWENVPGAFSSNGGKDFKAVLEETIRIAEPDAPDVPLPESGKWPMADAYYGDGWSVAYRVFDAQFWGVPQRRKRIALVADFGGQSAPEILFIRESVSGNFEQSEAAREEAAGGLRGGANSTVYAWTYRGRDGGCNIEMQKQLSYALRNPSGGGSQANILIPATAFHLTQDPITGEEIAPCLSSGNPDHGQASIGVVYGAFSPGQGEKARGIGYEEEKSPTLKGEVNGNNPPAVVYDARGNGDGQTVCTIVRRLTPLECERLQGYPDHYTDIGEWIDSKGKRHKEADSPRYKALGNSIALPSWKWVLKRISAQYERDATLGSLFDGISGFCLCWAMINGIDSCKWASEIESFPIAVSKKHFGDEETGQKGDLWEILSR